MSAYVRFILNRGMGDRGQVLSERSFATLTTPVLNDYAYGLWVRKEGGHTVIGSTRAASEASMLPLKLTWTRDLGLVLLGNSLLDPAMKKWIVSALTAAYGSKALPPPPTAGTRSVLPDVHEYAGGQFHLPAAG